jgi:hypothetical protein
MIHSATQKGTQKLLPGQIASVQKVVTILDCGRSFT